MSRSEIEEMEAVRTMVHCRLNSLAGVETGMIGADLHLDNDAASAFVEGALSEDETRSVISHLTSCETCRHFTARLIRLESSFILDEESAIADESPGRWRRLFEELASQVIPAGGEDAVFAYQNPDETAETPAEKDSDKPKGKP